MLISPPRILFPPRPKSKIMPPQLDMYEKSGKWVAQRKFNGERTLLYISADRNVAVLNRRGEIHRNLRPDSKFLKQLAALALQPEVDYWFDCEFLANKTVSSEFKNKLIIFDVLHAGRYLFSGPTMIDRYRLLQELCGNPTQLEPQRQIALMVSSDIWLAETFENSFSDRFKDRIDMPEIEGLVLKQPMSSILNHGAKEYEVAWQLRVRKPTKNRNN